MDGTAAAAGRGNASLVARGGRLYVVATPIGNLADVTERARAILAGVDVIACEDTRTTGALLALLGISARGELLAYHDHNETAAAERLVALLAAGKSVAVVSDAGTPGISDPGFRAARACRKRGFPVEPVPGACAVVAALSASGLPSNGFLFAGFLPPRSAARVGFLENHRAFAYTLALYESCHRVGKFVDEIVATLGPARVICVAKELSKRHETFLAGRAGAVRQRLAGVAAKGEFTVLIAPEGFEL
jgi:16S rRNA (cytidine1402-2'-O)-methyltransferase